ncbi:MAG: asparagine synthase (glutamine-hydrolyzing) [Sulfuritalea sp.]|nr:asparagine synthase (glutamine-hydrolyzing) [Sulfuritalea sp.]
MCGIAGFAGFPELGPPVLERMIERIVHRGPDDAGTDLAHGTGIGMRRLSIIDVAHGHQPISTADGCLSIVFNGEIYNYREIKRDLEQVGTRFHTNSDTETLLAAYQAWGVDCLHRLRGMFAFAILDHRDGALFIARDRLGVKPLYLARPGGRLVFGSEIKALLEHPAIGRIVNPAAVDDYLALRYVPGPQTMFQGIEKFPAAHYMTWRDGVAHFVRYWDSTPDGPWTGSRNEAQEAFDALFDEATRIRMISERPVGAFLSGGLDSTAIVSSLSKQFPERLKTFSVGFGWEGDELSAAATTARRLGCDHHEIICRAEDTALLPLITWHLDEPVGDGIILPMYLLSRLAARSVSVVQSGEGADEILGGYFMHRVLRLASVYTRAVPGWVQDVLVQPLVRAVPANALNRLFDYPGELGEAGKQRLLEFLRLLRERSTASQYRFIISLFRNEERREMYTPAFATSLSASAASAADERRLDFNGLLGLQFDHWLPDDILCKQDKLTMANSLEGRVPFMDHRLVELVMSFPAGFKIGPRRNKLPLRSYLDRNGAADTAGRRKMPFYIPIDSYLAAEPLRGMLEELLSKQSVERRGVFRWELINRLRGVSPGQSFLFGKQLFSLMMLELWWRIFIDREQGWV